MNNIQDYFASQWGWQDIPWFMWNWQLDPKKQRRRFYIVILLWNIGLNLLYFIIWLIDTDKTSLPYNLYSKFLSIFTPIPTLSIFIILQFFVTYHLYTEFRNGKRQLNKENIIWFLNNLNLIIFIILLNVWIWTYFWRQDIIAEMNWFWLVLLILSTIYLIFSSKRIFEVWKDIYNELMNKEVIEESSEEEEISIWAYDWVKEYYGFNMSQWTWNPITEKIIRQKLPYYRFTIDKYLTNLIWIINQTLIIEQPKLISKQVLDTGNKETRVQIDYPIITNQDEMNEVLEKLEFSNEYIQINNAFIGLKLRTKYLSNPNHLITIGDSILPDQKLEAIRKATFSPKVPLKQDSDEYAQMISEFKIPYVLFQNISIQKLWTSWYVILNFSKRYRRTVIFPQLDTLTKTLEKNNVQLFEDKPNPLIYFWMKSTGWLLGLTLSKLRHLIFGWESGSWKSVFLNSILYQILYRTTPQVVKLVLIDPLKVSFQKLKKLKNLAYPIAMSEEDANNAINYLVKVNSERYQFLENLGYEDIYWYNRDVEKKIIQIKWETWIPKKFRLPWNTSFEFSDLEELDEKTLEKKSFSEYRVWEFIPQIILVYDEFNAYNGESAYERNDSVTKLVKLWEQARKAWIILILGTQKISAESVPSSLRENMPTKICLTVWSKANSRAILGEQPENKSEWAFLTGYGDMLVFNKVELDSDMAIRAQWFFVSDDEMNDIIQENISVFGMNDFIYQDWTIDEYSWIKDFYSTEEITYESGEVLKWDIIKRNREKVKQLWIDLSIQLPLLIKSLNEFFKLQREQLLDKINLDDKKKNIKVETLKFQTEQEMLNEFKTLEYSNKLYNITKSFIRLKLDTSSLSTPDKLESIEEKLNLQLIDLKKKITFTPLKPYREDTDEYIKMLQEHDRIPYTLIDNFEIIRDKTTFYLQINYTGDYKKTVIFPQAKTIKQILTDKFGDKVWKLLKGEQYKIQRL